MSASMTAIEDFLAQHHIALVGLSHDPEHFSHTVFRALVDRGYDVIPVHPTEIVIEARPTYAHLQNAPKPVDGALVMTPADQSAAVVRDAIEAGVPRVWLYKGGAGGSVSEEAVKLAEDAHLSLVAGECPLMFLEDAGFLHRLHALGKQITGSYPR